ncbi:MAG: hypothetical protein ACRD1Z_16035, partial [Vicinamibacteria bacterium]
LPSPQGAGELVDGKPVADLIGVIAPCGPHVFFIENKCRAKVGPVVLFRGKVFAKSCPRRHKLFGAEDTAMGSDRKNRLSREDLDGDDLIFDSGPSPT